MSKTTKQKRLAGLEKARKKQAELRKDPAYRAKRAEICRQNAIRGAKKISAKKKKWHKEHKNWGHKHWQKFWDDNPERRQWAADRIAALNKTPEARERSGDIFRNLWKNDPGFSEKIISIARDHCEALNADPKIKQKRRLGIVRAARKIRPSKPQMELFKQLKVLGIKGLALEWRVGVGMYSLDIAYLPGKIDIESDGSYWHEPETDAKRDKFLQRRGWKVIRLQFDTVEDVHKADLTKLIKKLQAA